MMGRSFARTLIEDEAAEACFARASELAALVAVERAWLVASIAAGRARSEALERFDEACGGSFSEDDLLSGMRRDGVVVPTLIETIRARMGPPYAADVHMSATSQDIVDTAHSVQRSVWFTLVQARLDSLMAAVASLRAAGQGVRLPAITRMQEAPALEACHRVQAWLAPLQRLKMTLPALRDRTCTVQVGGPVGDRRGLGPNADSFVQAVAHELGLSPSTAVWHTDRSRTSELAAWVGRLTGALGKLGADVCILALRRELTLAGTGQSSSIPGKRNPIKAELLVALARKTAAAVGLLHGVLEHEMERSGQAWTLEQWSLPELCTDGAAALRIGAELFEGASWSNRT